MNIQPILHSQRYSDAKQSDNKTFKIETKIKKVLKTKRANRYLVMYNCTYTLVFLDIYGLQRKNLLCHCEIQTVFKKSLFQKINESRFNYVMFSLRPPSFSSARFGVGGFWLGVGKLALQAVQQLSVGYRIRCIEWQTNFNWVVKQNNTEARLFWCMRWEYYFELYVFS